ncbi:MAG: helix-turn-helix domain-containing protein [bacterium]
MDLEKAISEINELFFKENEGKVYRFMTDSMEKPLLIKLMEYTQKNQMRAAQILGINRNTLRSKLRKHGLLRQ